MGSTGLGDTQELGDPAQGDVAMLLFRGDGCLLVRPMKLSRSSDLLKRSVLIRRSFMDLEFLGNKRLVGATYQRNILLLAAEQLGTKSPRALLRAFEGRPAPQVRASSASPVTLLLTRGRLIRPWS